MSMKFYNIEDMRSLAESKNGQCVSQEYINANSKLKWRCNVCNYTWETSAAHILKGSWCPGCAHKKNADNRRLSIEMMQKLATEKKGQCVSMEYIDSHTKLKWMCEKGHIWEAKPYLIIQKSWCPVCIKETRSAKIDDFKNIAIQRGGECLSNEYINNSSKLLFRCAKGHEWNALPSNIMAGTWCPLCRKKSNKSDETIKKEKYSKKINIEDMQTLVSKKGGKCLSNEYINGGVKLQWLCQDGHVFEMRPANVKSGQWCPKCSGREKDTIENMHIVAASKGGKCLSSVYINTETKLQWQCEKGHIWFQTPHMIKAGNWCPYCAKELCGLRRLKYSIEDMREFAKTRGGECLSKDYNSSNKLLWKCNNGHTWEARYNSLRRGDWCPECNNLRYFNEDKCRYILEYLLEIKFKKSRTALDSKLELDGYNSKLKLAFEYNGQQHYEPIKRFHNSKEVFQKQFYRDQYKINECKEKGIRLIIIPYNESNTDVNLIDFITKCLGNLNIKIKNINKKDILNEFYKNCTPLNELKEYAQSKGGECLANEYLGTGYKIKWRCIKGHTWDATPQHIKAGHWCPECARKKKLTIESMNELAAEKGGKCLSEVYINSKTKLSWQCEEGHTWDAMPEAVKNQNQWCPICVKKNRRDKITKYTIEDMCKIAAMHKGKCLSNEYNGIDGRLTWQCKEGHKWETKPSYIIYHDSWCPVCAKEIHKNSNKISINEMKVLAKEKGGECLSIKYINKTIKLKWKCSEGHVWEAIPSSIKLGQWCPICAKK